jgi:hypothetical protein
MLMSKNTAKPQLKTTRQLNPVQLKKTIRPPSQKFDNFEKTYTKKTNDNIIQHKEIYEFLKDLNMESYYDLFINNAINTEEKIFYLNNDNLKLLSIPYAHRLRILKKIKEIETMQIMKKTITEKGGLSKIKLKKEQNTKYEEILMPKEEDDIDRGEEEEQKIFTKAILDYQKEHNKLEKNNQNQNELFTTGIMINNIRKKDKKDNNFVINRYSDIEEKNEPYEDEADKKSIGIGDNNEKVEKGEYIEDKFVDNFSDIQKVFYPLNKQKTLCYNCLHMILQEHCIQKFGKPFCSLHCLEIFEHKNVTECSCCGKKIEIINSILSSFKEKVYYCSPECLKKKEQNENSFINKSQKMTQNNISPTSSETSDNIVDILDL